MKTLQHEVREDSELVSKHSGLTGGREIKLIEFRIYEHLFGKQFAFVAFNAFVADKVLL